ncbi:MAG: hypothetical protein Q7U60_12245, partial [Candidatus Methanoperedens sp.]|nr:hypothetical protein [Candidatus Methanoperedens sp.]
MEPRDIFEVSDIRGYVKDLDEDALIEKVIIPLYQKRNFLLINRPSHGPGEHGKDIIFRKIDSFLRPEYHAIQAKVVKIDPNNVGKIINQARAAFNVSFRDSYLNIETKVDFVEVITSGKVTNDAEKQFHDEIPDRRHIILVNGEQLIDQIARAKNDLCKVDSSQTAATVSSEKIPSNISSSPEFKIEGAKQLPWEASVEQDLKKLKEEIREGKLIESGEEIIKIEEKKFSKTIPLEAEKGQLLYYREITQRDTTRISIIPSLPSQSESIGESRPKETSPPSLELSHILKGVIASLSEPERKLVEILNYCNGIDENTLKCIMTVNGLDITALESIKRKDIVFYNKETLNLPESFTIDKIQLIHEVLSHLLQPIQTSKEEFNSALIRALNVCKDNVLLILSIIDKMYDELDEGTREELLT